MHTLRRLSCFSWTMRARERDGQKSLGKRGRSHKSVYWAVPETCRRTLGSGYQISNPISQMPSLLRHHMRLPDAVLTVTYMQRLDCLRADVSSNSGTRRRTELSWCSHEIDFISTYSRPSHAEPKHQDNWDRQFPAKTNTFISKGFPWEKIESLACCICYYGYC